MTNKEQIVQVLSSWLGASDANTAAEQIERRLRHGMVAALPWRVSTCGDGPTGVLDCDGDPVATVYDIVDAEYIVSAVNDYEKLIKIARFASTFVSTEDLERALKSGGFGHVSELDDAIAALSI